QDTGHLDLRRSNRNRHALSHTERRPAPGPSRTGRNKRTGQSPQCRPTPPEIPAVSTPIPASPGRFVFFSSWFSWLAPGRRKLASIGDCKIRLSSETKACNGGVQFIGVISAC